jgi:hypothetical protein
VRGRCADGHVVCFLTVSFPHRQAENRVNLKWLSDRTRMTTHLAVIPLWAYKAQLKVMLEAADVMRVARGANDGAVSEQKTRILADFLSALGFCARNTRERGYPSAWENRINFQTMEIQDPKDPNAWQAQPPQQKKKATEQKAKPKPVHKTTAKTRSQDADRKAREAARQVAIDNDEIVPAEDYLGEQQEAQEGEIQVQGEGLEAQEDQPQQAPFDPTLPETQREDIDPNASVLDLQLFHAFLSMVKLFRYPRGKRLYQFFLKEPGRSFHRRSKGFLTKWELYVHVRDELFLTSVEDWKMWFLLK